MIVVSEQLREMQQTELEIFKEFIKVCEKLNIKYYLASGTLLGAVRHQGFIPWDDDIDVCMFREDYERFLVEAPALLPPHLFLQTHITDPEYPQVFAKIRNTNTTFIETSVKNHKMNHGLYIDIFAIDGYSQSKKWQVVTKIKRLLLNCRTSYALDCELSRKVRFVRKFMCLIYPKLETAIRVKDKLNKSITTSDWVTIYSSGDYVKLAMPRTWYGEGTELTFEGLSVLVPEEYDKWLTKVYGDYMQFPPVEKRVSVHPALCIDTNKSYLDYVSRG